MIDQYVPKNVVITPEVGDIIRQFRLANNVPSKSVADHLHKSAAYVSKLERGVIKKIATEDFIQICDHISKSENGVREFLKKTREIMRLMKREDGFSSETKLSLNNINDCVLSVVVTDELQTFLSDYLSDHQITFAMLVEKVNQVENLGDPVINDNIPVNQWVRVEYEKDYESNVFQPDISLEYLYYILQGTMPLSHRGIMMAILESSATLAGDDELQRTVNNRLAEFGFFELDFFYGYSDSINPETIGDISTFDTDTRSVVQDIVSSFKIVTIKNPDRGVPGLTKLSENLRNDLGFAYAYLNTDLSPLKDKTREQKQQFLNEVRELVKKYSEQDPDVELFY